MHVINLDNKIQQKSAIELIGSQFISFKDFIEKMNTIIKESIQMSSSSSLKELMQNINRAMPIIFNAEKVLLWTADYVNFLKLI